MKSVLFPPHHHHQQIQLKKFWVPFFLDSVLMVKLILNIQFNSNLLQV